MSSDFKIGIKTGLIIYGVGIVFTIIVHLIFGWDYPHGPPSSALPLFLTLLVGALRLLLTLMKTMTEKSQRANGELLVHVTVALLIFASITWLRFQY